MVSIILGHFNRNPSLVWDTINQCLAFLIIKHNCNLNAATILHFLAITVSLWFSKQHVPNLNLQMVIFDPILFSLLLFLLFFHSLRHKMLGLFSSLTSSVPIGKKLHEPATEGTINRLHYRVTVLIFLGCSLIVTCLEWVGNGSKISCVMEGPVDSWTIPQNVINTYCYVLTTFTIPKHWNTKIGHDSAQIGVGHYNPKNDDVTYKAYYQWVPFVLFLQVSKMRKN